MQKKLYIPNESAMLNFGAELAKLIIPGMTIFLSGELGAGKTTLTRGFLQSLGHQGAVKSPTYTLVEAYTLDDNPIYHFDFYRLQDPMELEDMGLRDYLTEEAICLIEWPERAAGWLPDATLSCTIELVSGQDGRNIVLSSNSTLGDDIIAAL